MAHVVKIYSDVSGPGRETLKRSYRRFGLGVLAGLPLFPVAIVLSPSRIAGALFILASACLLMSGTIALFNVGGMAKEMAAQMQHLRRSFGPSSRYSGGVVFARLGGLLLVAFGLLAALLAISMMTRNVPLTP